MQLPNGRQFNPYRKLAATTQADALWARISNPVHIQYMIGAIRVGRPAIDAVAEDLCTHPSTAPLFDGRCEGTDQWKQFAGKMVAMALAIAGYEPVDEGPTYNNAVIRNGALYAKKRGQKEDAEA